MLILGFNIHFKRTAAFYTEAVFNHDFFIRLQSYSFSRTYNDIPRGLFVNIFLSFLDINFPFLRFGYPPSLKVEHPIVHF